MCYRSEAMIPKTWNLLSSGSAKQPADYSEDRSATQPAGELTMVSTSLCLFARLPLEIWRWLVGLLSYSDVAACSCVALTRSDVGLLFRCGCCVSTFKRLLVEYGAITWIVDDAGPDYGTVQWDPDFWSESEERKHFWRRAIEIIFLYEPKSLQEGQRCDKLIQQDYIQCVTPYSCGVLFASNTCVANHQELQRQFRAGYGAPNHLAQPWFPDYYVRGIPEIDQLWYHYSAVRPILTSDIILHGI